MKCAPLLAALVALSVTALGQNQASVESSTVNYIRPLITQPVDETRVTTLKKNTHPLARMQFDIGGAPPNLPMDRMLLVLKRTPEQQAALKKLLDDQQDKFSPNYHNWLTPDEFGKAFGPSDQDVQTVTSWLHSHGFRIDHVSRGKTHIEFSGDAGQVQQAFQAPIHKYSIRGEEHWANAADPQIPAALVPAVAGIATLHSFHSKPQHVISPNKATISYVNSKPQVTFSGGVHALGPADFATIYNLNPLYNAGINGSGITIAVVARSNLGGNDVFDFDNLFGLFFGFRYDTVLNGPDPGVVPGDDFEATLDVTWAGAVAPSANVRLVVSASTNTTDGVELSKQYIVDNNLADIMTESFGICEAALTSAELASISAMNEQASAQGITHTVSTGDTGSAGCDNLGETTARGPVSVNALASNPFALAVGGTLFNDAASPSTYWNSTNNPTTFASAKSYIPEKVWNETCTTTCTPNDAPLAAGGGGASIVNHSVVFPKPSWQSGVAGIPNDGARDIPDVSLTAAIHDGYVVCYAGSCSQQSAFIVGGTSASAPAFAAIMALVDQKMARINPSQGARQGQANYVLYKLAAKETFSQCNASSKPASNCVFNDVTSGNNCVPGMVGYGPSCTTYAAKAAFDLATGLGSVNATNLVNNWNTVTFRPTLTTLVLNSGNPVNVTHGQSVPLQVTVAPSSGTGTPIGNVTLITNTTSPTAFALFTLNGGSVTSSTSTLPGGAYNLTAHYSGDPTFAPSDSSAVPVTVTPEPSTTTFGIFGFDQTGNMFPFTTASYGSAAYLRADVAGHSGNGTPGGQVFFNDGVNFGLLNNLNSQGNSETATGVFNLTPGSHAMAAQYLGDASFASSTSSPPITITITLGPTNISVVSSATTVGFGSNLDLNAIIGTSSAGFAPSNTVTFLSGGTQIGTSPALESRVGIGNLQTGQFQTAQSTASFSTSQLALGQHTVTAQYAGDFNYSGSTSAPIVVNVVPDFSVPTTLSSITVSAGQSGTTTLTITGQTGYKGKVNFSAASCSGLPSLASCSFSPASITGNGKTTITVTTTAAHTATLQHFGIWQSAGTLLASVLVLGMGPDKRRRNRFLGFAAVALLATALGCGGGGGNGGGAGQVVPGTPLGSFNVVVTATGSGLTHTTAFTLTVR